MDPARASKTAMSAAHTRAYHFAHDTPHIFADPLAELLLSADERKSVEDARLALFFNARPGHRDLDRAAALRRAVHSASATGVVLARSRYTEDALASSMENNVSQYVILGAGLDTFAYRRTDLANRLRVFEVDHPATQTFKQQRLAAAGLAIPANVSFGAADFENETVAEVLSRLPFDPAQPTFFSWLGVTMYLTHEANLATLRSVRSIAALGSEIVFTYFDSALFRPQHQPESFRLLFEQQKNSDEPFVCGFDPSGLGEELANVGFELVEDLGRDELDERYFRGRSDDLHASETRIAHARVV